MNHIHKIDFDEASRQWMRNKVKHANCTYTYVCGYTTHKGYPCQNKPYVKNNKFHKRCHVHFRKKKKE